MLGRRQKLFDVFVEDLETLDEVASENSPIRSRSLRATASPILRRWIVDGDLIKLERELGSLLSIPTIDAAAAFEFCNFTGAVEYMSVSGAIIQQYPICFSGIIDVSRSDIDGRLLSVIFKEATKRCRIAHMAAGKFSSQPCLYFQGSKYNRKQLIAHMANKRGGTHTNFSDLDTANSAIDRAAQRHRYGKGPDGFDADDPALKRIAVTMFPHSQEEEFDCVTMELIASSQMLVRSKFNGQYVHHSASSNFEDLMNAREIFVASHF